MGEDGRLGRQPLRFVGKLACAFRNPPPRPGSGVQPSEASFGFNAVAETIGSP